MLNLILATQRSDTDAVEYADYELKLTTTR